mgnify:FL=1
MKTLVLKNNFQMNMTMLPNSFVDHYMANANGEFVKVYLFLLRHVEMVDWVSPEFSARAYSDQLRARRSCSMRPKISNVGFSRSMVDLLVKIVVITYDFIVPRLDR